MSRTQLSLILLVIATGAAACGLAAGGVAASVLGVELSGSAALTGLPLGLLVVGAAIGALLIARLTPRLGRLRSLSVGYATGATGALAVVAAARTQSFPLLLFGITLVGTAQAAMFLSRYAAAAGVPEHQRGRMLGMVLFCVALGAVVSPRLLSLGAELAAQIGLSPMCGVFLIAAAMLFMAMLLTSLDALIAVPSDVRMRPMDQSPSAAEIARGVQHNGAMVAMAVLALTNILMVSVMTVVPIDLLQHGQSLDLVGSVISAHLVGMFAPSMLTGWLADRWHPRFVSTLGLGLLLSAALSGLVAHEPSMTAMTAMLIVLGVGWNCGIVGGSALLVAAIPVKLRPQAEAIGEIAMGTAAAIAAPLAGLVLALAGIGGVWLGVVGLASLALSSRLGFWQPRARRDIKPALVGSESSSRLQQYADASRAVVGAIHDRPGVERHRLDQLP